MPYESPEITLIDFCSERSIAVNTTSRPCPYPVGFGSANGIFDQQLDK